MKTMTKLNRCWGAIICSAILFACSDSVEENASEVETPSFEFESSKVPQYLIVLDSLHSNGYVPFFRLFEKTRFDFEQWNINSDESIFIQDSISYYNARKAFFNQDKDFVYWLVNFKNDTIVDTTDIRRTLWSPFINPYSSSISPCSIITSKSRQAINLVYGFLDGEEIECVECFGGNHSCAISKYEYVEKFLNKRRNLGIEELRKEWKPE